MLITRQALVQGLVPVDVGALNAKDKGRIKGKGKEKPDAEVTCYHCSKVGYRRPTAGTGRQHRRRRRRRSQQRRRTPRPRRVRRSGCVDVGSLEVGPLSACTSESWILSVEVAEIDESWTTHREDWVMVVSGAGVSACPVNCAPHIGQKTVGCVTRDGANVEIAFEAAKVRRPTALHGVPR